MKKMMMQTGFYENEGSRGKKRKGTLKRTGKE